MVIIYVDNLDPVHPKKSNIIMIIKLLLQNTDYRLYYYEIDFFVFNI